MLDYFCVFTKGGTLLWALSFVGSLKGDPINTLIRACLLEERAAQSRWVVSELCLVPAWAVV